MDPPAEEPSSKLLADVAKLTRQIAESGREQLELGQFMLDLTEGFSATLEYRPSMFPREQFIELRDRLSQFPLQEIASFTRSVSSTSLTLGSTIFAGFSDTELSSFASAKTPEQAAYNKLWLVVTRKANQPRVFEFMRRFGLDIARTGKESPLSFLEAALAAFERPSKEQDVSASSLIPMRSALEGTVDSLFARRRAQEPASGWEEKIRSISTQARRDGISDLTVSSWASQCHTIIQNLSLAKEDRIPRSVCESRLRSVQAFIAEFLEGLDPHKMRA